MEKKMENEMETGFYIGDYKGYSLHTIRRFPKKSIPFTFCFYEALGFLRLGQLGRSD